MRPLVYLAMTLHEVLHGCRMQPRWQIPGSLNTTTRCLCQTNRVLAGISCNLMHAPQVLFLQVHSPSPRLQEWHSSGSFDEASAAAVRC